MLTYENLPLRQENIGQHSPPSARFRDPPDTSETRQTKLRTSSSSFCGGGFLRFSGRNRAPATKQREFKNKNKNKNKVTVFVNRGLSRQQILRSFTNLSCYQFHCTRCISPISDPPGLWDLQRCPPHLSWNKPLNYSSTPLFTQFCDRFMSCMVSTLQSLPTETRLFLPSNPFLLKGNLFGESENF